MRPTATYAETEKLGNSNCGYCDHRTVAGHEGFTDKPVRRCAILGDLAPASRPACCHYVISVERSTRRAAWYKRARKADDSDWFGPRDHPTALAVELHAGNRCPRCGSRLLHNYRDLICLMCGTQQYGEPWVPSPSVTIYGRRTRQPRSAAEEQRQ